MSAMSTLIAALLPGVAIMVWLTGFLYRHGHESTEAWRIWGAIGTGLVLVAWWSGLMAAMFPEPEAPWIHNAVVFGVINYGLAAIGLVVGGLASCARSDV